MSNSDAIVAFGLAYGWTPSDVLNLTLEQFRIAWQGIPFSNTHLTMNRAELRVYKTQRSRDKFMWVRSFMNSVHHHARGVQRGNR